MVLLVGVLQVSVLIFREGLETTTVFPYSASKNPATYGYAVDSSGAVSSTAINSVLYGVGNMSTSSPISFTNSSDLKHGLSKVSRGFRYALAFTPVGGVSTVPAPVLPTLYFNTTFTDPDAVTLDLRGMVSLVVNALSGSTESSEQVNIVYQDLPKGAAAIVDSSSFGSGGLTIFIGGGFALLSALYAEELIRDRLGGKKHSLEVASLDRRAYFLGNMLTHCMFYTIPFVVGVVIMAAFSMDAITKHNPLGFILLFVLFCPACVLVGYTVQYIFPDLDSAQVSLPDTIQQPMIFPWLIITFVCESSGR